MLQPESAKTLYLLSLGCPKNRVDSEIMLGTLLNDGYRVVDEPQEAEVILINSCAFIGEAKQESIDAIFEHAQYKETGNCKSLVVTSSAPAPTTASGRSSAASGTGRSCRTPTSSTIR
jgi:ribosomal protein S12 methylthiotransferase